MTGMRLAINTWTFLSSVIGRAISVAISILFRLSVEKRFKTSYSCLIAATSLTSPAVTTTIFSFFFFPVLLIAILISLLISIVSRKSDKKHPLPLEYLQRNNFFRYKYASSKKDVHVSRKTFKRFPKKTYMFFTLRFHRSVRPLYVAKKKPPYPSEK